MEYVEHQLATSKLHLKNEVYISKIKKDIKFLGNLLGGME